MVDIDLAAQLLVEVRRTGRPLPELPPEARPSTTAEGYDIADRVADLLGLATVGWKVGATAPAVQSALGLSEPIAGRVFETALQESPALIHVDDLITPPAFECEIGVRLGRDLGPDDGPFTTATVAAAIDAVLPTIEIVASRFAGRPDGPCIVADNALAAYLAVGEPTPWASAPDLTTVRAAFRINGESVGEAGGDAVLGGPLGSLLWLANHLAARGQGLAAGTIVSTGALTGMHPVGAEDVGIAELTKLGRVSAHLVN